MNRSSELEELSMQVRSARRSLDRRTGEARAVANQGKLAQKELKASKEEVEIYDKIAGVLTSIGEDRQQTAQIQIEALVSQGLRTIFGEEFSFHVISSVKGKAPVTEFLIRSVHSDGKVLETAVEDRGGGISAVVGFLLRLVIMLLSLDKQESIIFLDETFAELSDEYGARLAEFIREVVDKTGVQLLLVTHTHVDEFLEVADKRYAFERGKDGLTTIKEL